MTPKNQFQLVRWNVRRADWNLKPRINNRYLERDPWAGDTHSACSGEGTGWGFIPCKTGCVFINGIVDCYGEVEFLE